MEEKIIGILQKQVYNLPDEKGHSIEVMEASDIPASAKEISALFREFIEWMNSGCETTDTGFWHVYHLAAIDADKVCLTVDELFDYWWNNIKNK